MSDIREEARRLLREGGLRVTEPRVSVLSAMIRMGRPASAAELIEALEEVSMSEVTIYRNLNRLTDAGLLLSVDTPERRRRFELKHHADHAHDHAHFVCNDCGSVTCLTIEAPRVSTDAMPHGFEVEASKLVLHGRCAVCA